MSDAPPSIPLWRVCLQSLKGENHDYTTLPLRRAVLLLAVPMVLEMIMESLFAISDVFWVSRLGRDPVAIVGLTESLMTIIYSVAIGIAMAATALVSRRIGEKEPELAAHAAAQVLILASALAVVLGLLLGGFAEPILRAMSGSESIVAAGTGFARWMLGGNITVFLIFVINAAFRGAGDAVVAMRTLWLANTINIILGPCLIFGWGPFPALGVTGAAIATTIGRGTGVIYQLWHLAGHHSRLRVTPRHFWPDAVVMASVLRLSGTGVFQFFINTSSWVCLMRILGLFGSAALAGYTISVRITMLVFLPAWGLANAGATLAGQNLGAGQPDRAESAVWIAVRYSVVYFAAAAVILVGFAEPLVKIFSTDPEVIRHGTRALWVVGLGFPLIGPGMALTAAFNGAGDPWTPTRMNFVCFWLGELPLAYLLAVTCHLGPTGVFISIPLAFSTVTVWSAILFRRGEWKTRQV